MVNVLRLSLILPVLLLGESPASADKDKDELHQEVQNVRKGWQAKDKIFNATLKKAYAYVIFPEVGKDCVVSRASCEWCR